MCMSMQAIRTLVDVRKYACLYTHYNTHLFMSVYALHAYLFTEYHTRLYELRIVVFYA
jgi:hypothetical protein